MIKMIAYSLNIHAAGYATDQRLCR